MTYIVAGIFALGFCLLCFNWLTQTTPRNVKLFFAFLLTLIFLVASVFLFATGKFVLSIPTLVGAFVAYQRYRFVKNMWDKVSGAAGFNGAKERASRPRDLMSKEDAAKVLGVDVTATKEEIKDAHKKLMMKFHPDQGGNDYQAQEINQAKDVLLD